VTQGRPVLPCAKVPSLVDSDGSFLKPAEFRRRWRSGRVNLQELQDELRAQVDRLTGIMGPLDFWNTHQDSHIFPGLFQAFARLGRELEIPAMRCHRRITIPRGASELSYQLRHPQYWLKGQVISWWSSRAETSGALMPDARVYTPGYADPRSMIEEVSGRLDWSRISKAVEVIIHPATEVHADLFGSMTESRIADYRVFRNPDVLDLLRKNGIEPAGFEALRSEREQI
jgi:predicted glycoside hydrolase/deacetylase ChbG (UPF0249 family)